MDIKERYTPETITVYPIDMKKLNASIDRFFHESYPDNKGYRTHGTQALIRQPILCLIDDEFIGGDIKDKVTFYVYESETDGDGKTTHNCFPTHEITLTLAELEKYLLLPVSLAEFTQDRRGYNSRIRSNEADWMRFFNRR